MSSPKIGEGSDKPEGKVGRLLEDFGMILTWFPRIFLVVLLISFLFYFSASQYSPELMPGLTVENVLYLIRKILEFLYSYVNVTALHVVALIVMCILISNVFSWRWVVGYLATIFIIPIGLACISSLLGVFFSSTLQPVTGYSVSDLLLFGFVKMLQLNYLLYRLVEGWVGQQAHVFVMFFMIPMSCLGFLAMYVDKKLAERSKKRIPEVDLVRYALLGGGVGVMVGAFLFRHKTKHVWLLTRISLVFFATSYVLFGGILHAW